MCLVREVAKELKATSVNHREREHQHQNTECAQKGCMLCVDKEEAQEMNGPFHQVQIKKKCHSACVYLAACQQVPMTKQVAADGMELGWGMMTNKLIRIRYSTR